MPAAAALLCAAVLGGGSSPRPAAHPATATASDHRLPLGFEPNWGQSAPGVGFVAHRGSTTLLLTGTQTAFAAGPSCSTPLRIGLAGANPAAAVERSGPLPGVVNYLQGRDPVGWRTGIPTYARVISHGVYPGIDLVRHGSGGELDGDLVLAPGADPRAIALRVDGADAMGLDSSGDIRIRAGGATVVEHAPRAWQTVGGVRRAVPVRYRIRGDRSIALDTGAHDPSAPLRIEPATTFDDPLPDLDDPLGTRGFDQAAGIAVDPEGDAYITGATASSNFPTTSGAAQTKFGGETDAFVSKLNPSGTELLYSTYLGGSGFDQAYAIAVDQSGSAYIAGATDSADFPTTARAFQPRSGGDADAFVARLNPAGSALVYSTYLGGQGADSAQGIALDPAGNAYVTGLTRSPNFPVTPGALQTHFGGGDDAFVAKITPDGSALGYATYLGGADLDQGTAIAVDRTGSAVVAGTTSSPNFPTTAHAFDRAMRGTGGTAFVSRLNPAGTALLYSSFLGGKGDDEATGVALDPAGDAYVTGFTASTDFPVTRGAYQTAFHGGGHDAFVTRINPLGTGLIYSTYLGGTGFDLGLGIAVDPAGSAYVTGTTSSKDFPITPGVVQAAYGGGGDDAFLTRLDPTGRALLFSTFLGGGAPDRGAAIAVDPSGNAYVAGVTGSVDFPTTKDAVQPNAAGGGDDAFVTRLDPAASTLTYSTYLGGRGSAGDLPGL